MIRREAEKALLRLASQFQVVAVTGPRQSGKTTLVKQVFPDKRYVSMDDKELRELAKSNPKDFISAFPDGVIIDEAQKVPELFDALKLKVDEEEYSPGKYVLTGSSQFRLKENITDSLSGRAAMIRLLPFSIKELKEAGILISNPYEYAFAGFYPPLYDSRKSFLRDDWFENYIETYLDMDIKDMINPSNMNAFRKFLQLCAIYSGQMINMDSMSRDVGVSATTIKSWLSMLEASYVIHFLEPESNNLKRTLVKTPKLYFIDTGLMCYLLRLDSKEELLLSKYKGAVVETMAVSELLKTRYNQGKRAYLTYLRDRSGFEVDVIASWKNPCAIEIKSDSSPERKFSSNLRKFIDDMGDETKGKVFYLGDVTCNIDGVEYVSWTDWSSDKE